MWLCIANGTKGTWKKENQKYKGDTMHLKFMEMWLNQWNRSWSIGKKDGYIHLIMIFYDKFDKTIKPKGH